MSKSKNKNKPPADTVVWRRKELDHQRVWGPFKAHEFDLGEPYEDVIVVPMHNGALQHLDISRKKDGIVAITFRESFNNLYGLLYTVKVQ